jgi:glycosyltransferase involved in cell wall biosynthesis
MANIILSSTAQYKGIITFSHKELLFIEGKQYSSKYFIEKLFKKAITTVVGPLNRRKRVNLIESLKQNYFIGVHWGWHSTNVDTPDWVDFHMASEGTLEINDLTPVIRFASTNFLPDCYLEELEKKKIYDVATVCRDIKFKGISSFIDATSKLMNTGQIKNVLMIIPESLDQYAKKSSFDIRKQINQKFNADILNQVHYLRLSAAGGFLGTNREFISNLMRQTKVFCLLSEKEGVAKVLNEAQLCGANIVANSRLVGGGLDHMDHNFFFPYEGIENVGSSILKALTNQTRKDKDLIILQRDLTQKFSYPRFISELSLLLNYKFPDFTESLYLKNNLSQCLPNHHWWPWASWIKPDRGMYGGCDIRIDQELKGFIDVASN